MYSQTEEYQDWRFCIEFFQKFPYKTYIPLRKINVEIFSKCLKGTKLFLKIKPEMWRVD